jgi:hypothetical protein
MQTQLGVVYDRVRRRLSGEKSEGDVSWDERMARASERMGKIRDRFMGKGKAEAAAAAGAAADTSAVDLEAAVEAAAVAPPAAEREKPAKSNN